MEQLHASVGEVRFILQGELGQEFDVDGALVVALKSHLGQPHCYQRREHHRRVVSLPTQLSTSESAPGRAILIERHSSPSTYRL